MAPFNHLKSRMVAFLLAATMACAYLILLASLSARRTALIEKPGSTLPAQIQKNIDGMWSKSLSAQHSSSSRSHAVSLPSSVLNGPGHQWEKDPFFVTEMGLDDGNPNLASDFGRMIRSEASMALGQGWGGYRTTRLHPIGEGSTTSPDLWQCLIHRVEVDSLHMDLLLGINVSTTGLVPGPLQLTFHR
eukprot:768559-Hanusia_phi.AAC.4